MVAGSRQPLCQKQAQSSEEEPDLCSEGENGVALSGEDGIAQGTNLGLCSDAVGAINPDVFS